MNILLAIAFFCIIIGLPYVLGRLNDYFDLIDMSIFFVPKPVEYYAVGVFWTLVLCGVITLFIACYQFASKILL